MTALRLERFGRDTDATWGRLYVGPEMFFTAEPPWRYNRPFHSCIPDGIYELMLHDSEKHPGSWAMVGEGLSYSKEPETPRYSCLIHAANWPSQLSGCIAPGLSIKSLRSESGASVHGVSDSRKALVAIGEFLAEFEAPQIEIVSLWRC